jgi:hypothetical protein
MMTNTEREAIYDLLNEIEKYMSQVSAFTEVRSLGLNRAIVAVRKILSDEPVAA